MDREKTKAQVVEVAKAHGGRYFLPHRYRLDPLAPKSPVDHVYDACEDLVTDGSARWLRLGDSWESGPGPGIELKSF